MQIRMKTVMAGPEGTRHPGQIVEVSVREGEALVSGGFAEQVGAQEPEIMETAEAPAAETTAGTPIRRRRGR